MAWQERRASVAQIAVKAHVRPVERNLPLKAPEQRTRLNRALAGLPDGLEPLNKRRITTHLPLPRFTKVATSSESRPSSLLTGHLHCFSFIEERWAVLLLLMLKN
jgi:hypothetical protein